MPTARHRVKSEAFPQVGSSYWRIRTPKTVQGSVDYLTSYVCDDVVGNYPNPNGFNSSQQHRQAIAILNGQKFVVIGGNPILDKEYANFPSTVYALGTLPSSWAPTSLELQSKAFDVQVGTNLSAPHVSVPTAIGELKDLPSLVKDWGGNLLKKAAKAHLSWRWAIKPMMSDFRKLLDFRRAVSRRYAQINRLAAGQAVHMRFGLGTTSVTTPLSNIAIESSLGEVITCGRIQIDSTSTWGTCLWKPSTLSFGVIPSTDEARLKQAYRLTYGITGFESASAAWELLPWSWFVDWFAPLGDSISLLNNTLQLTAGSYCIMRKSVSQVTYNLISGPSWVQVFLQPNATWGVRRQRFALTASQAPVAVPSLTPLLDSGKWSILASLAAVRGR